MRLIGTTCVLLLLVTSYGSAGAWPKEADCPLVHPDNPPLKFVDATLDQHTDGPPRPPDRDTAEKLPDGMTQIVTYYASYEILRDAILICSYSEVRNGRAVRIEAKNEIRIPLPGILMRCEGIKIDRRAPRMGDWKRRWCVHDPDK
ncbi:MAG: hypothetical protein HY059_18185 [Proteobacteria bacterium]|nr:hypothetical protein [Pseudomonadota bacterium]